MKYESNYFINPYAMDSINKTEAGLLPELLSTIKSDKIKQQVLEIFYRGKTGSFKSEGLTSKDNPDLELARRKSLIEIARNNPGTFQHILENNINLYHGTNANALPGILKYGLLSEDASFKKDNPVITGEEATRRDGVRRGFVSFSDQLSTALQYSNLPYTEGSENLSFGIVIGISSENIGDLKTFNVPSEFPELGIVDELPKERIKTIFAPKDKMELLSRMIGDDSKISIASIEELSSNIEKKSFKKEEFANLAMTRKTSKIQEMIGKIKNKFRSIIKGFGKDQNRENISGDFSDGRG